MNDFSTPFGVLPGNVLLGGLPLDCGPEIVISHIESVARLGATVTPHTSAVTRISTELDEAAVTLAENAMAMEAGAANIRSEDFAELIALEPLPAQERSLAYELSERFLTDSVLVAQQFGLVFKDEHEAAVSFLARYFREMPERSVADLLLRLPEQDRARWAIPDEWATEHLHRAAQVDKNALLLGLHELRRAPWREYGGLVAGRLATSEYQLALRGLNRHVVAGFALHDWFEDAFTHVEWMEEAVSNLHEMSVPFALPKPLDDMLRAVGTLFMDGQFGAVVVMCRSVLEVASSYVNRSVDGQPELNLATLIDRLATRGALTSVGKQAARDIRVLGNKAVHEDFRAFETPDQARRAIGNLVLVMNEMRTYLETRD